MLIAVYIGMSIRVCSSALHITSIVSEDSNTKIIVS
jgi:hypothetical protein